MNASAVLPTILYLMLPLIFSGIAHTVVIKLNLFPRLTVPISERLFGANKTLRGFVVVPLLTGVGVYLVLPLENVFGADLLVRFSDGHPWLIGLSVGLVYMLFELPNSYLKRKLGIPPGERANRGTLAFSLLDQTDSALGCVLFYWVVYPIPGALLVLALLASVAAHLMFNVLLYSAGLRKELV